MEENVITSASYNSNNPIKIKYEINSKSSFSWEKPTIENLTIPIVQGKSNTNPNELSTFTNFTLGPS